MAKKNKKKSKKQDWIVSVEFDEIYARSPAKALDKVWRMLEKNLGSKNAFRHVLGLSAVTGKEFREGPIEPSNKDAEVKEGPVDENLVSLAGALDEAIKTYLDTPEPRPADGEVSVRDDQWIEEEEAHFKAWENLEAARRAIRDYIQSTKED